MNKLIWNVYLSGEIHTTWREEIKKSVIKRELPIKLMSPITNHSDSDDCGVKILGPEENKFWYDYKGASINSMRTKNMIEKCDICVVRFGDRYKQWNAAFDAGIANAMGKSIITLHDPDINHALKEIDSVANAVCFNTDQVVKILNYITTGFLDPN